MIQIATFNVNGLKAILKNCTLSSFLNSLGSDIICLQETKITRSQLTEDIAVAEGYEAFFSFCAVKEGYSGVVTFVKSSSLPVAAEAALLSSAGADEGSLLSGGPAADDCAVNGVDREGRVVLTEHRLSDDSRLVVINVYCPYVDEDRSERMAFKLAFYDVLEQRCRALHRAGKLVVVVGDVNCSYNAVDSAYAMDDPSIFSESPSRQWLKSFVSDKFPTPSSSPTCWGLVDAFRALHPTSVQAYTCWSTATGARATNYGTRIDYVLLDSSLQPLLSQCSIQSQVPGSDHCPVTAVLAARVKPAATAPLLASTNFPEFAGKQSSLKHFFVKQHLPLKSSSVAQPNPLPKLPKQSSLKKFWVKQDLPLKRSSNVQSNPLPAKLATMPAELGVTDQLSVSQPVNEVQPATKAHDGLPYTASTEVQPADTTADSQPTASQQSTSLHKQGALSGDWKKLLKGLPPPPLCTGHKERAVLRTVKKDGPNKTRQFYVCARPTGSKNNPAARCDFFEWLQKS